MAAINEQYLRAQLEARRHKLDAAMAQIGHTEEFERLVQEVDHALARIETGTYGTCEACHDPIEPERLLADPLACYCLDHLNTTQRRALQDDLELAARIQRGLLPKPDLQWGGWLVGYHFQPAGPVSGDYCDVIAPENESGEMLFVLGDVSGKGVAASMRMAQLHAMFRSLTSVGLRLGQIVERVNQMFCESAVASQYATLVCGHAKRDGQVELFNAGHWPVLLVRKGSVTKLEASGVPLGMFCKMLCVCHTVRLEPGDNLLLFSDGATEARDPAGAEYGLERLSNLACARHGALPDALIADCLKDVRVHAAGARLHDDLTLMALHRKKM